MVKSYDAEYFEPKATLEFGQVFRYEKVGEQDYIIHSADKIARVFSKGDATIVDSDFPEYFSEYFDTETDYETICRRLSAFEELQECVKTGRGIRILKQNFDETVLSFIISANNNIPRIKGIIERLCENFGKDCGDYKAFPTTDELKDVAVETYRNLGCGFRDRYLAETVKALRETDIKQRILQSDTPTACKLLCSLSGIGPKVADCIALFGMSRTDCYPVDTWIFKSNKSQVLDTPAKVRKYYLDRYGADAGYAQQYLFYKAR